MAVSSLMKDFTPSGFFMPADVESVITTAELSRRPARAADHAAENQAVLALMDEMASATGSPEQTGSCRNSPRPRWDCADAHSAGVSLLEREGDQEILRWRAIAGRCATYIGGSIARTGSPCGLVLDRNMPILMNNLERHYGYVPGAAPACEVLLIPFHHDGEPVGALWIVAHDDTRSFDDEDRRLLTSLARFATTAYQLLIAQALKHEVGSTPTTERRRRSDAAAGVNQERLEAELADSRLLHTISAELIDQGDVELHEKILDAAIAIVHSDCGCVQRYVDGPEGGTLEMLAYRGFPRGVGQALRDRHRTIAEHVRRSPPLSQARDRARGGRLRLHDGVTGAGALPGRGRPRRAEHAARLTRRKARRVISTHWKRPHQPSERDLRLLDILARQAADLIERKQADEALREADRRKDEFLAMLAHELRNPLAPIRNAIEVLQMKKLDAPELQWASGVIDRQMGHLTRLVDDLLDVSRITRDRLELRVEQIDLAKVVQAAIETSRPGIVERGQRLTVTPLPQPVIVLADPTRGPGSATC